MARKHGRHQNGQNIGKLFGLYVKAFRDDRTCAQKVILNPYTVFNKALEIFVEFLFVRTV